MKLTRTEVEKVAQLARLRLTSDEKERFTKQIGEILQYMEKLAQLDTTGVEPFRHAVESSTVLREDRVTSTPNPESILGNAPARMETFFRVPKIIE